MWVLRVRDAKDLETFVVDDERLTSLRGQPGLEPPHQDPSLALASRSLGSGFGQDDIPEGEMVRYTVPLLLF